MCSQWNGLRALAAERCCGLALGWARVAIAWWVPPSGWPVGEEGGLCRCWFMWISVCPGARTVREEVNSAVSERLFSQ